MPVNIVPLGDSDDNSSSRLALLCRWVLIKRTAARTRYCGVLKFVFWTKLWEGIMKRFKSIASVYESWILIEAISVLLKVFVKLYQVTIPNGLDVMLLKVSGGTTKVLVSNSRNTRNMYTQPKFVSFGLVFPTPAVP